MDVVFTMTRLWHKSVKMWPMYEILSWKYWTSKQDQAAENRFSQRSGAPRRADFPLFLSQSAVPTQNLVKLPPAQCTVFLWPRYIVTFQLFFFPFSKISASFSVVRCTDRLLPHRGVPSQWDSTHLWVPWAFELGFKAATLKKNWMDFLPNVRSVCVCETVCFRSEA